MAPESEAEFNELYCARVRMLREEAGFEQQEMADLLGLKHDTYRRYEGGARNSPLPPYLVERFAIAVHARTEFVLTGKGKRERK